jgi:hypothetical protein
MAKSPWDSLVIATKSGGKKSTNLDGCKEMDGSSLLQTQMSIHRGCVRLEHLLDQAELAGVSRDDLRQAYTKGRYKTGIAAGVRYIYRPSFLFETYAQWVNDCDAHSKQQERLKADKDKSLDGFDDGEWLDDSDRLAEILA